MIRSVQALAASGPTPGRLARWIGSAVLAGAILAALGPFGSALNGGPVELLGYWVGSVLFGLLCYGSAVAIVGRIAVPGSRWWWLGLVVAALIASLPEALLTRTAALWLWPALARIPLTPLGWYAQTALLGLIATLAAGLAGRRSTLRAEIAEVPEHAVEPRGRALAGDVLALQMEDHYVRVHRPGGSELILMPLTRAMAAVAVEGLRTHRSWWVARRAVVAVEGDARAMRLRLANGLVAPVARSAVTHLRAAGWIARAEELRSSAPR